MLTILTAAATFSACGLARHCLDRPGRRKTDCCRGRVRLTSLWNSGAAFDLPLSREAVAAGSLAALLAVLAQRRQSPAGAGLALGGGLSNLWERLRYGRVYDYLRFPKAPGPLGRYVFNLADFAIALGAAGLLLGRGKRAK